MNENITLNFVWDAAKVVLRGKFIAINVYIRKEERTTMVESDDMI